MRKTKQELRSEGWVKIGTGREVAGAEVWEREADATKAIYEPGDEELHVDETMAFNPDWVLMRLFLAEKKAQENADALIRLELRVNALEILG